MSDNRPQRPRLVQSILDALASVGYPKTPNLIIHVSVATNVSVEKFDAGVMRVRWLCWSLLDERGEIWPPEFEIASEAVTRSMLDSDLPSYFPGVTVIVDDDICV